MDVSLQRKHRTEKITCFHGYFHFSLSLSPSLCVCVCECVFACVCVWMRVKKYPWENRSMCLQVPIFQLSTKRHNQLVQIVKSRHTEKQRSERGTGEKRREEKKGEEKRRGMFSFPLSAPGLNYWNLTASATIPCFVILQRSHMHCGLSPYVTGTDTHASFAKFNWGQLKHKVSHPLLQWRQDHHLFSVGRGAKKDTYMDTPPRGHPARALTRFTPLTSSFCFVKMKTHTHSCKISQCGLNKFHLSWCMTNEEINLLISCRAEKKGALN